MNTTSYRTRPATHEGTVPARATQLYYRTVGGGAPLIIVHGGPGLGHTYLSSLEALADGFRVVFYDQRGSGRSEAGDPALVTIAGSIDDLESLLDGIGVNRANLLGHSFGANLSALFASRRPDRVASLVLANPGPPFDPQQQAALWAEMDRRRTAEDRVAWERLRASEAFVAGEPTALEEHVRFMYMPFLSDRRIAASLRYGFTAITAANFPHVDERMARDLDAASAISDIAAIRCPTLVVYAERDPIPETFARQLVKRIPRARYAVIEDANHFAFLEAPDPFFAAVRPFLEEVAR